MTSNQIPRVLARLLPLATRAKAAVEALAVTLGILQNTAVKIGAEITDLTGPAGEPAGPATGKMGILDDARKQSTDARAVLRNVVAASRTLVMQVIDALRPHLGRRWTSLWQATGLNSGSLAVPADPYALMISLREYLRRNAAHEVPATGVTAAALDAQIVALEAARREVDRTDAAKKTALVERDQARDLLMKRMSALRYELESLLSEEDARWYEFGFRRPIDSRIPDMVDGLTVTAGLPGELVARWEPASLAENYAVSKQVVGIDAEPVFVKRVSDPEVTLRDLPAGATVKVIVVAHNGTGDSLPVEAVAIVG